MWSFARSSWQKHLWSLEKIWDLRYRKVHFLWAFWWKTVIMNLRNFILSLMMRPWFCYVLYLILYYEFDIKFDDEGLILLYSLPDPFDNFVNLMRSDRDIMTVGMLSLILILSYGKKYMGKVVMISSRVYLSTIPLMEAQTKSF